MTWENIQRYGEIVHENLAQLYGDRSECWDKNAEIHIRNGSELKMTNRQKVKYFLNGLCEYSFQFSPGSQ